MYVCRGDKGEHPEKVKLLLENGAPVNARGPSGKTALHYAAGGFSLSVELLLKHGATVELQDDRNATPLDLAIKAKIRDVIHLINGGTQRH